MTEGEFFATCIMMNWTKIGRMQIKKRIKGREIIILSRTYSVLVMNSDSPKFRDQVHNPISFDKAMEYIDRDFDL